MRDSNVRPALAAAGFVLIPVLYVGSYLALLEPTWWFGSKSPVGTLQLERVATYRYGGSVAQMLFWPIHQFDRQVRPNYWKTHTSLFPDIPTD